MQKSTKPIILSVSLAVLLVLAFLIPSATHAEYYLGLCTPHSYERCSGSYLYWYDSCGNQQGVAQYCQNGCYNNSCRYGNNYGSCTYHAYRLCVGNSNIYWYDSCGNQQDLYYSCSGGQVCNNRNQYGQCAPYFINPVPPPVQPAYNPYYKKACYGNNVEWYDSLGVASGLYKKCADSNSCTQDTCSAGKCSNALKCDGTTCAAGSADYNSYCATNQPVTPTHCGNGLCETTLGETNANCPADCKINAAATGLSISFFAKQDSSPAQWEKSAEVGPSGKIYFMISATNSSAVQIDNVNVSANIPTEISSLGNLKVDGASVAGDIVSGISIGSIAPQTTKLVTFEGRTQTISGPSTKQATATSNVSGVTQSDSVSINLNPNRAPAAAVSSSGTESGSGFWGFLKRWYLWIIVGLVLIFLFIVVFRRLSSNV